MLIKAIRTNILSALRWHLTKINVQYCFIARKFSLEIVKIAPKKMSQICIFYLSVHPRPRARNHELSGDPCFRENRPDYTRRSVYKLENLSFVKNKYR